MLKLKTKHNNLGYSIIHSKQYIIFCSNLNLFYIAIFTLLYTFIIKTIILRQIDISDLIFI